MKVKFPTQVDLNRRFLRVLDRFRLRTVVPLLSIGLFTLALVALYFELRTYRYEEIIRAVRHYPPSVLILASLLTVMSHILLTSYDTLAFRYVGRPRPYRETALPSFVSNAIGNIAGFSPVTSGAIRYRFYTKRDVPPEIVGKIVAFCTLSTWLGFIGLIAIAFMTRPGTFAVATGLPRSLLRILGIGAVGLIGGYLVASIRRRTPLRIRGHMVPLPSPMVAGTQLVLSSIEWITAGSVLYVLWPVSARPPLLGFLALYLVATLVGLVSSVPGGLGVFEAALIVLLPAAMTTVGVVGALVAYRAIYYLLPLALSGVLLGTHMLHDRHDRVTQTARTVSVWSGRIVPDIAAWAVVAAGGALLITGALPSEPSQLRTLAKFVPLPVIETSHFLGSVVGVTLLVLGRGLQRRLRIAFYLTVTLLVFGTLLSVLQGIEYEAAVVQLGVLGVIISARRAFYRESSLTSVAFTPGWIAAVVGVFIASVWLGFVAYRHVTYTNQLWWQFALTGNAPRFLRASVGAAGVLLVFYLIKLLQPATALPSRSPTTTDLEAAQWIAKRSTDPAAYLALLGDKSLLFDDDHEGFVMYRRSGRTWVAMAGPIGPRANCAELAWKYRELVSRNGGRPAFYEIGADDLPLVLELGLTPYKLGEQAYVPLEDFSLEGSARKDLRYSHRRAQRDGCTFEIIPRETVPEIMDTLSRVSEEWLEEKGAREIGFSLGYFDPTYLAHFPVAVVQVDDEIVAFANVLDGGDEVLSVDLMRYSSDAPSRTMDYLFIELMLYGATEGYERFDIGMAPLSGLDNRPLSPLWNRVGTEIYQHGNHFYNYQGLRTYKEKFDPVWEPRYLACSGSTTLPFVLLDIVRLITGRSNSSRLRRSTHGRTTSHHESNQ